MARKMLSLLRRTLEMWRYLFTPHLEVYPSNVPISGFLHGKCIPHLVQVIGDDSPIPKREEGFICIISNCAHTKYFAEKIAVET